MGHDRVKIISQLLTRLAAGNTGAMHIFFPSAAQPQVILCSNVCRRSKVNMPSTFWMISFDTLNRLADAATWSTILPDVAFCVFFALQSCLKNVRHEIKDFLKYAVSAEHDGSDATSSEETRTYTDPSIIRCKTCRAPLTDAT